MAPPRKRDRPARVDAGFHFWLQAHGRAQHTIKNYMATLRLWTGWCQQQGIEIFNATADDIVSRGAAS